jgi:hypothetical protein
MSPLWPYAVSTALTLDSRPTVIVDLTDHTTPDIGGGIETVSHSVVWSAENLQNTNHTLRISVGRGQGFAIVDGIMSVDIILLPHNFAHPILLSP